MSLKLDFTDTTEIHDLYESFTGRLAFDVGANGGQLSNIFAERFDSVVACEPADEPYLHLLAHAAPNVKPQRVAVSDQNGFVTLQHREMSGSTGYLFTGDSLPEWGAVLWDQRVMCVTLDFLTASYGSPDFVKVDVEGHELKVMRGGLQTIFRERPAFLIEIHSESNGMVIHNMLTGWGLTPRIIRHESHAEGGYSWKNHYWLVSQ